MSIIVSALVIKSLYYVSGPIRSSRPDKIHPRGNLAIVRSIPAGFPPSASPITPLRHTRFFLSKASTRFSRDARRDARPIVGWLHTVPRWYILCPEPYARQSSTWVGYIYLFTLTDGERFHPVFKRFYFSTFLNVFFYFLSDVFLLLRLSVCRPTTCRTTPGITGTRMLQLYAAARHHAAAFARRCSVQDETGKWFVGHRKRVGNKRDGPWRILPPAGARSISII